MELLTVVTFLLGAVLLAAGWHVAIRRRCIPDISGWRERARDGEGLASWVGLNLIVTGLLALVAGTLQYLFPLTHATMFLAYIAVIVPLMTFRILRGSRRYLAPGPVR